MPLGTTHESRSHGALSTRWLRILVVMALLLPFVPRAEANSSLFYNTYGTSPGPCTASAPCWQAGMFGILVGLGSAVGASGTLAATSNGDIVTGSGDIGIGSGSFVNNGTHTENWTGPIDFADAGTTTAHTFSVPSNKDVLTNTTLIGGTTTGNGNVTTALNQVLSMSNYWGSQTAMANLGNLTGGTIGSVTSGSVEVFKVTSINLTSVLTIRGGADDLIIIDDPAAAIFKKNVVLTGGITPDQVLFNFTGTSGTILSIVGGTGSNKINISADMIVRGAYTASNATVNGRILGGWSTLTLGGGFALVSPSDVPSVITPEPSTWLLMLCGMGGLFYFARRFDPRHRFGLSGRFGLRHESALDIAATALPRRAEASPPPNRSSTG